MKMQNQFLKTENISMITANKITVFNEVKDRKKTRHTNKINKTDAEKQRKFLDMA